MTKLITIECQKCFKEFEFLHSTAIKRYCDDCVAQNRVFGRINMKYSNMRSPYLPSNQNMVWDDVNCLDISPLWCKTTREHVF